MNPFTEIFQNNYQGLAEKLSVFVNDLAEGKAEADVSGLAAFLGEELLPHSRTEKSVLYPAVEPLIKTHGKATATMAMDHEFIEAYVQRFLRTAEAWKAANSEGRKSLEGQLRYMALHIEVLFKVHLEKEKAVFLPLLDAHLPGPQKEALLTALTEGKQLPPETEEGKKTLDVRSMAPRLRHPLIFQTFDSLQPEREFVLVNDHDPKPLFYQFQAERDGQFTWTYLEEGPEVWRVRIGRKAAA